MSQERSTARRCDLQWTGCSPNRPTSRSRTIIGHITRSEAAELCRLSLDQAKQLLLRMVAEGQLAQQGTGKATCYELAPEMRARPHFRCVVDGTPESQMRQYSPPHALEGRFIEDYHKQRVNCKKAAVPRRLSSLY
jgi:hypothetical protein